MGDALAGAAVFMPGLGAIGSAALSAVARTGVGRLVLIDDDVIGYENFSSQLFAVSENVGRSKVDVAAQFVRSVHPGCTVETHPVTCDVDRLCEIIAGVDVVVLGMDTLSGGVACNRAAHRVGRPVVDFLYFPTVNVMSTLPGQPAPEERFGYPTAGLLPEECDANEVAAESLLRVVAYGFAANPGLLEVLPPRHRTELRRFLRLVGPIPSFAPMTMEVGALMAREVVSLIARSRGLPHLPLAWPAFFSDHYRLRAVVPEHAALAQLPEHEAVLDQLRGLRDAGEKR